MHRGDRSGTAPRTVSQLHSDANANPLLSLRWALQNRPWYPEHGLPSPFSRAQQNPLIQQKTKTARRAKPITPSS